MAINQPDNQSPRRKIIRAAAAARVEGRVRAPLALRIDWTGEFARRGDIVPELKSRRRFALRGISRYDLYSSIKSHFVMCDI